LVEKSLSSRWKKLYTTVKLHFQIPEDPERPVSIKTWIESTAGHKEAVLSCSHVQIWPIMRQSFPIRKRPEGEQSGVLSEPGEKGLIGTNTGAAVAPRLVMETRMDHSLYL
jgi:hypothetical protein